MPLLPLILLAIVIVIALFFLVLYNTLVTKRNRVDESWSDIDVQLKRRHDLIPNLVESVKAYAQHEREVFENVTRARSEAMTAQTGGNAAALANAENMLSSALKSLFAVAEAYPALRANENFLNLQTELAATEDKIAAARRFYNGLVRDFNTAIQQFPAMLIAGSMGFKTREFFEMEEGDRQVPDIGKALSK
ncbi:LemA family protein [Candidatus Uhrbacteria bacterium]|nr:LemA family protein [Candidatus Uhrbacteria bacterium]